MFWLAACAQRVDEMARSGVEKFDLCALVRGRERASVVTLPRTIARLTKVKELFAYGSALVRIPPEVGAMTALESLDPRSGERRWPNPLLNEGFAEYLAGAPFDLHLRLTDYVQGWMPAHRVWVEGSHCWDSRDLYHVASSFMKFVLEVLPDGRSKAFELLERSWRSKPDEVPYFPEFLEQMESVFRMSYAALMAEWNRVLEPYWGQHLQLGEQDRTELEDQLGSLNRTRYLAFGTNLTLRAEDGQGKWHRVEATPEHGWRVGHRGSH